MISIVKGEVVGFAPNGFRVRNEEGVEVLIRTMTPGDQLALAIGDRVSVSGGQGPDGAFWTSSIHTLDAEGRWEREVPDQPRGPAGPVVPPLPTAPTGPSSGLIVGLVAAGCLVIAVGIGGTLFFMRDRTPAPPDPFAANNGWDPGAGPFPTPGPGPAPGPNPFGQMPPPGPGPGPQPGPGPVAARPAPPQGMTEVASPAGIIAKSYMNGSPQASKLAEAATMSLATYFAGAPSILNRQNDPQDRTAQWAFQATKDGVPVAGTIAVQVTSPNGGVAYLMFDKAEAIRQTMPVMFQVATMDLQGGGRPQQGPYGPGGPGQGGAYGPGAGGQGAYGPGQGGQNYEDEE
jgi:hypothetical protein